MYSKNDYRYYLEDQLMHSDDFLAHYGIKGMRWKNHKPSILADQDRGLRRTEFVKANLDRMRSHENRRTTQAPNMYHTRKKNSYSDNKLNRSTEINSGGSKEEFTTYGQMQKNADMRGDKRERRKAINQQNKFEYDKKKSLKKNIRAYKNNLKKKRVLKKRAYQRVDALYNG